MYIIEHLSMIVNGPMLFIVFVLSGSLMFLGMYNLNNTFFYPVGVALIVGSSIALFYSPEDVICIDRDATTGVCIIEIRYGIVVLLTEAYLTAVTVFFLINYLKSSRAQRLKKISEEKKAKQDAESNKEIMRLHKMSGEELEVYLSRQSPKK